TGTFSLYPTKNITSGEGGMITTDDPEIAEKCRTIRQHGARKRYYHDELGFNFRMTDVHAAIGLAQLQKLEWFNQARQSNARYLTEHLRGVVTPYVPSDRTHVFHQYTIRVPDGKRDALRAFLQERGIGSEIYYPLPIHRQRLYRNMGYDGDFPEAERAAGEVLSLPVHPALSLSDLEAIVAAVNEFTEREGLA
ncbi:MAG: DegT/DnrJ/EryC1/StrS family aminotransferase, partial [Anaerolineae bacterium]